MERHHGTVESKESQGSKNKCNVRCEKIYNKLINEGTEQDKMMFENKEQPKHLSNRSGANARPEEVILRSNTAIRLGFDTTSDSSCEVTQLMTEVQKISDMSHNACKI